VNPAVGRDLLKNDDRSGAAQVAIVSDALWRRHWNGDRSVVGRAAVLDNAPVTIVGCFRRISCFPAICDRPSGAGAARRPAGVVGQGRRIVKVTDG